MNACMLPILTKTTAIERFLVLIFEVLSFKSELKKI